MIKSCDRVMWSIGSCDRVMWSIGSCDRVMWLIGSCDQVVWLIGSCDQLGHVMKSCDWVVCCYDHVMWRSYGELAVAVKLSLGCWVCLFILHLNSVKVAKAFICFSKKPKRILYLGVWTISGFCVPFQEGGHCQMGFKFHTRKAYWSLITMGFQIRVVSGWESWAAILSLLIGAMSGWGLGGWRGWSLAMWCNIECIL